MPLEGESWRNIRYLGCVRLDEAGFPLYISFILQLFSRYRRCM